MKVLSILTKWLFILCLPILLLTASIAWAFNSVWLYEYGFEKYNISRVTGLASPELNRAATGLIGYFNSDEDYINLTVIKDSAPFELFNEREVAHLRDVKGLIWLDYRFLLGTLIYVLGYAGVRLWRKDRRQLARGLVYGNGLTLALMLLLGLGALMDFDRLFLQFHLISFANEFWLLDPSRDYLIMLFPQGFWYDAFLFIALATAFGAIFLGGLGGGYLVFKKRNTMQ